ncbi:probable aminopeptidase NPEPL1 [Pocillopora damicornis]|uniref:probable aminopeptidase NPEPL1 n=1 Tax=Pocillopora damicornis TaxID=46731 RepID=UPI000F54FD76|nr:probable aminopeptidase NPEPL1 [Pocillopora damicornis]
MVETTLIFSAAKTSFDPQVQGCLIIGKPRNLQTVTFDNLAEKLSPRVDAATFNLVLHTMAGSDACPVWLNQVVIGALPNTASRHNSSASPHFLNKLVCSHLPGGDACIVVVCERHDAFASACAISRAFPTYSRKTSKAAKLLSRTVTVEFILVGNNDSPISSEDAACMNVVADSIRLSARLVDMPCGDLHTTAFVQEITKVGEELGIVPVVIKGEELDQKGFGGLYGVGKAAVNPPALVVLSHTPMSATRTIAWCGKGIVYDTGGLCIKAKTSMLGMKRDCGGAAGILGAFRAAVKQGFTENLHAVFCMAENAVGPDATRPDDILTLYSGKTVEVNNTDAEGRLVLGDGVAYAKKDLHADVVLDMATLTGAQGIATGRYHASLLTNKEVWEPACAAAGRASGDLVFPIPYCPELHFSEFSSALADMKNSVQNRDNAQVSCAGLFIGSHLGFDFPGSWLHIDMAAPAHMGERATGYGVALLVTLFGKASSSKLLQSIAPELPAKDSGFGY